MRYSDELIHKIKDSIDIVEFIGERIKLTKSGKNYKGLCPFHHEKTPSFIVSPSRQSFHCFGCSKGGTIYTFLMEVEKITFPESVQLLARRAGIVLESKKLDTATVQQDELRNEILKLQEWAAKYFQERLLSPQGVMAQNYLQQRGINLEGIQKFQLGYAPAGWDLLKQAAQKEGWNTKILLQTGLLAHHVETQRIYDKFRNRIIFPVKDIYGRIIAFGGRLIEEMGSAPKYLNSPETLFFKKGECLYLLDNAKSAMRQKNQAIVVEGYFDAISLHQAGFENVVATLGTALTLQHATILRRYSQEVVLFFDADRAGRDAAIRGGEILLDNGLAVRILTLENAKDPDEFLKKYSSQEMAQLLQKAPNLFRWWARMLKPQLIQSQHVEDKLRILNELVPLICKIPQEIEIQAACMAVESEVGLDYRTFLDLVNQARKKSQRIPRGKTKVNTEPPLSSIDPWEIEGCFFALLSKDEGKYIPWIKTELAKEMFVTQEGQAVFERITQEDFGGKDLMHQPEVESWIIKIESFPDQYKNWREMLIELLQTIKKRYFKEQIQTLKEQQKMAEKESNMIKAVELGEKIREIKLQILGVESL